MKIIFAILRAILFAVSCIIIIYLIASFIPMGWVIVTPKLIRASIVIVVFITVLTTLKEIADQ